MLLHHDFVLHRLVLFWCLALGLTLGLPPARAVTPEQALRIVSGDSEGRIAALAELVDAADPALGPLLKAILADEVKLAGGRAYIVRDDKAVDAASGAAATLPAGAEDVINNNRMRRELEGALAALRLFSKDRAERVKAIDELKDQADESRLGLIEKAAKAETDS